MKYILDLFELIKEENDNENFANFLNYFETTYWIILILLYELSLEKSEIVKSYNKIIKD